MSTGKNNTTKLVFIGDEFYRDSGSWMSSIYTEIGERYDWGFVNRDLRSGKSVTIRQATKEELVKYQGKLLFDKLSS